MRDLNKYISDYHHLRAEKRIGGFRLSDLDQIKEMDEELPVMIHNAMAAGFVIGYRAAKSEIRRKGARAFGKG